MARHRYFIFNHNGVLVLGVLQIACAGLCLVCGFMDTAFRRDTPLSSTRTPVWGALVRFSALEFALKKAITDRNVATVTSFGGYL